MCRTRLAHLVWSAGGGAPAATILVHLRQKRFMNLPYRYLAEVQPDIISRGGKFHLPLSKTGFYPGRIFNFCIAIGEFWYIFGERNKLSSSLELGSGVLSREILLNYVHLQKNENKLLFRLKRWSGMIVPGKIFEVCIAVGELQYIFRRTKPNFSPPKTKVRGIVPGRIFEFPFL